MDIQQTDNPLNSNIEEIFDSRRKKSWIMWVIGGLPIFVTFLQTPFAVAQEPAVNVPIVGSIASYLRSFAFLDRVAIIFYESSTTIAVLFIVITLAWIAQGVALTKEMDRKFVWAVAGAASIFFFVLFFGVYWSVSPFVGSDFPIAQRMAFFFIPFGASGAVLASALLNPDLANEIIKTLSEAEEGLKDYKRDLSTTIDNKIGKTNLKELESSEYTTLQNSNTEVELEDILSINISDATQPLEEQEDTIEKIETTVEDVRDFDEATESVLESAKKVRARVRTLQSPSELIKEPNQQLRSQLQNAIGAILQSKLNELQSLYGDNYNIKNLGKELQTVDLQNLDGSTSVTNSANYFEDLLNEDIRDIGAIIRDFQFVIQRINDIDELIDSEHKNLQSQIDNINDSLSKYDDWLDRIDDDIRDEIENKFSEGHGDADTVSKQDINDKIKEAKTYHYNCQFDDQDRILERAAAEADLLIDIIEYVSTLASSAQSGTTDRSFQIPTYADRTRSVLTGSTIEHMDNAFQKNYAIGLQEQNNRLRLVSAGEAEDSTEQAEDPSIETSNTSSTGSSQTTSMSDGLITDGVNTLLGQIPQILEDRANERHNEVGNNHLSIISDELPSLVTNEPVLEKFESLLAADTDVKKVETQAEGEKVKIILTLEETGASMEDVITNTKQRLNNE